MAKRRLAAREAMPCGSGLVEWVREGDKYRVLSHVQCCLRSDHIGDHVTIDGERWPEPEESDDDIEWDDDDD